MHSVLQNFSRKFLFLGIVALLLLVALGGRVITGEAWGIHVAQVGSALQSVTATVLVSPTEFDCSEAISQTRVHFNINPIMGGEVTVNDHGVDRTFDALGRHEEAPLSGYFPNGEYIGRLNSLPGYVVLSGAEILRFSVNSCKKDISPTAPAPLPPPAPLTGTTTAITTAPVTKTNPPSSPKVEATTSIPLSPLQAKVSTSTTTNATEEREITTSSLKECASEEACLQICEEGNSSCTSYATELILEKGSRVEESSSYALEGEAVGNYIAERDGIRVFADADSDGIVDFDEVNIYGTDPKRGDSDNDGVTDGDELVLHADPKILGTTTMIFQDPDQYGVIAATGTLGVTAIVAGEIVNDASGAPRLTSLILSGHGPRNAYVTLFIYSEPIVVTVKTDRSGAWTYRLDKELPDGSHKVYTALTDNGGRVIAKSEPLPFVKEAGAISIGAAFIPSGEQAPSFFGGASMVALVSLLALVLLASVIILGAFVRTKKEETSGTSGTV